ncbi:MAPEG family protein [Aurantiacibacter sp. D1-12]|uniref:MAPEG family protein n=1 Tax=Aurantiacibacter sp. D1-12 TaxID=2993658 RepID=UPI00237D2A57|nr:MAPEG family protein [Aurantiacibacter sp. D1-12]MDE1466377.1 MAPEG family protein [Aurantiacibacter sp. D1-12]
MPDLHITLLSAGIAALTNLWLAMRCGRARTKGKIAHGDGGDVTLQRAMRAQSNFIEYTPLLLLLVFALEITGHSGWLLGVAAGLFLIGRILHAIGLDADKPGMLRMIGMMCTLIPTLGLAIAAILAGVKLI